MSICNEPGDIDDRSVPDIFAIHLFKENFILYDVDPKLNSFDKKSVSEIIRSDYLNTDNIPIIEHDYKVKLHLTSDIPISYSPRRISYA